MTAESPTAESSKDTQETEAPGRGNKKMRALHVPIPEGVYWHVRKMALESRLPFKEYMARFLEEAWAYPPATELKSNNPPRPN